MSDGQGGYTKEEITFEYYDDGKLKKKIYPDGGYIEYQYDCVGRRTAVLDFRDAVDNIGGTQAIYYSYDALGRLATVTRQDGRVIEYAYDATGSRTEVKVTENGQTIYRNAYTYDSADRLYQVHDDPTGQSPTLVATYNYDVNGNRSLLYYDQVGLGASYTYNDSNQLTSITSAPASFTYTVDALGRRANANETLSLIGGGAVSYTVDYAYDDLSRLIQDKRDKTGAGTLYDVGYEYDAVGNPLAKIDNLTQQPTDNYTYWPGTDKLFQINGADDRSYDPNGNTTDRAGGDIYEYDYDNMLKRVIKQDGATYEYYYDPDGARIRKEKIQNGQIVEATNYIIDGNTSYAQVILEIDDQSTVIASYTYGDDLLKVSRNGEYFYWYDGLGSVRIITDITGAVVNRYTYDAYGNLVDGECAETIANEYKFTGERVDAETGFVYLRARMYEPGTGRFLTRDAFHGVESDPLSLHKYLYCHDDPANRIDLSGNFSLPSISVNMGSIVSLGARLGVAALKIYDIVSTAVSAFNVIGDILQGNRPSGWDIAMLASAFAFAILVPGGSGMFSAGKSVLRRQGGRLLRHLNKMKKIFRNRTGGELVLGRVRQWTLHTETFGHILDHTVEFVNKWKFAGSAATRRHSFWPGGTKPAEILDLLSQAIRKVNMGKSTAGSGGARLVKLGSLQVEVALEGQVIKSFYPVGGSYKGFQIMTHTHAELARLFQ